MAKAMMLTCGLTPRHGERRLHGPELAEEADGRDTLLRQGILRIGPAQVSLQALSFRPLGTANPLRFLADYVRFLCFSSREMRGQSSASRVAGRSRRRRVIISVWKLLYFD